MGATFQLAEKYIHTVESNSVFVEIGSDRGEGSTLYLGKLAEKFNTVLHTVDLVDRKTIKNDCASIIWHIEKGSKWASEIYPTIGKKISLLYLDNFDWIWDTNNVPSWIQSQIVEYKIKFDIEMNNKNCQHEHLLQAQALAPWMADTALILCDDTFPVRPKWQGKCGLVVPYFESIGFQVVEFRDWCGVVMTRGLDLPKFVV